MKVEAHGFTIAQEGSKIIVRDANSRPLKEIPVAHKQVLNERELLLCLERFCGHQSHETHETHPKK